MPDPKNDQPEKPANRSSAMTPEVMATLNSANNEAIQMAVREAVTAVFAQLKPVIESIALTPEKIREANKPYKDPVDIARQLREMTLWKEDEAENRRKEKERQDACPHEDQKKQTSIRLIRNYPDRQPRGICVQCHALIHPREWRIGAPDAQHPRGKPYLVEPHKDYKEVMVIVAHS